MIETRITSIEEYRRWTLMEDIEPGWLVNRLTAKEETPKMRAGTAFHKAMENASETEHGVLMANGHRFDMLVNAEIALPSLAELKLHKDYGELRVSGTLDGLSGHVVTEFKTTERFDADNYLEGLQWRFYLDLSGADRFDWHVFEISAVEEGSHYEVWGYHKLTEYRYPRLARDCQEWAEQYLQFAERFMVAV